MSAYSFQRWGQRLGRSIFPPERGADRATKEEVIARLTEAHVALTSAAEAFARRYGSARQVTQLCGAATLITNDWIPEIEREAE